METTSWVSDNGELVEIGLPTKTATAEHLIDVGLIKRTGRAEASMDQASEEGERRALRADATDREPVPSVDGEG
jgi:hypothetical protein